VNPAKLGTSNGGVTAKPQAANVGVRCPPYLMMPLKLVVCVCTETTNKQLITLRNLTLLNRARHAKVYSVRPCDAEGDQSRASFGARRSSPRAPHSVRTATSTATAVPARVGTKKHSRTGQISMYLGTGLRYDTRYLELPFA
jgi:hypothetical protein